MKEKSIQLLKKSNEITVIARELGLSIIGYWEVAIEKETIIQYINSYNSSPNEGFMELDRKVVLSHKDCKILFSKEEANEIINLINEAYMN